jgi:proline- and glutamine-rich splicing factor
VNINNQNQKNFNPNNKKPNFQQGNNQQQQGGGGGKPSFQKHNNFNTQNNTINHKKFNPQQFNTSQEKQQEKKFTGRCRLFVGNLPPEMSEEDFKQMFVKYGEVAEVFVNKAKMFGLLKLDTRVNAEQARQELDGKPMKGGRFLRVRFATHAAAIKVKHLSPFVSNEYLEHAFSQFGTVERAVIIVDDKGKSTGEGIVEFERKPNALQCIQKCTENSLLLGSYPRPVVVEPFEQKDEEDGLPEKTILRNPQFYAERESTPRFVQKGSFEQEISLKWLEFYDLEKQINEEAKRKIDQAREILEYEIEQRMIDQREQRIKEDLQRKQEELQRIEEMRKNEMGRRKDFDMMGLVNILFMLYKA